MRRAALALALLVCPGFLAGCGSGTRTATRGADLPPAPASSAVPVTTAPPPVRGTVSFPAKSADDVVRLALLRPPGKESYEVAAPGGVSYTVDLASDDRHALVHSRQRAGEVWVGLSVSTTTVDYTCTAITGGAPTCHKGDPGGEGAKAAAAIAAVVGSEVVRGTFVPAATAPGIGVGSDSQAGIDVSCMAGTIGQHDIRLCAAKDGRITELTAAGTSVKATAVSASVTASDLAPPAAPS